MSIQRFINKEAAYCVRAIQPNTYQTSGIFPRMHSGLYIAKNEMAIAMDNKKLECRKSLYSIVYMTARYLCFEWGPSKTILPASSRNPSVQ